MTLQDLYDNPKSVYFATDDTSFVSGDSPATLDIKSTLSKNGNNGYVICDGAGDILVTISQDGTNYGNSIRLKNGDEMSLKALSINKIKITHSGTDSAYRVYCE